MSQGIHRRGDKANRTQSASIDLLHDGEALRGQNKVCSQTYANVVRSKPANPHDACRCPGTPHQCGFKLIIDIIFRISLRNGPMIAPNLRLRIHWAKDDNHLPQDTPRVLVALIVILALVNVSATVLMIGDWATMTNSMAELERNITDHLTETSH